MLGEVSTAFEKFLDQKWKDLHIVAAGDLFGAMAGRKVNAVNAAHG
jgi:hypothetical protein